MNKIFMKNSKMAASKRTRLSNVMKNAWAFFKNGIVSFSISLKLAWSLDKGLITMTLLNKYFKKHRQ
jgi:hypothetical protein